MQRALDRLAHRPVVVDQQDPHAGQSVARI
jgi:hypothetical protein